MSLNETPSANRLHIGIFGKTNSGKSTFLNAFTGQQVSIVSEVRGTTTDPVTKAMEVHPLGPCIFIDTAGLDDDSELGKAREEKTWASASKCDIALIVVAPEGKCGATYKVELELANYFKEHKTPCLFVVNKCDENQSAAEELSLFLKEKAEVEVVPVISALTGEGLDEVKTAMVRLLPENYGSEFITGNLVEDGDLVLLVMPQDIQAPKGRLILPQVQTIRELLDRKCLVLSVTTDKMVAMLEQLVHPPKLIITDSQVFGYVYEHKPAESMLTSFSVLFAAYKGDLAYYLEGAKMIDALTEESKVLIAECCTHAPLQEDIGREKIPNLLRRRVGTGITVDIVSGTDFPEDPSDYDLIIQCGACMFNRKYVLSRIDVARNKGVPMTNYGVTIAHLTGILDKIACPV